MRKLMETMALLTVSGIASAQSSITLYGSMDAAFARGTGSVASKSQMVSGSYKSSYFGFRGKEELGGGLAVHFQLESGLTLDTGGGVASNTNNQSSGASPSSSANNGVPMTFNRRSIIGLTGDWGELRLGRDYTPQYFNANRSDPFGVVGVGASLTNANIITGVTSTRASNSIGYLLPAKLGGVYGQVIHYRGENSSGSNITKDGNGSGLRVGYASGPLDVALALSRTRYFAGDSQQNNIAASWNFGVVKLLSQYSHDRGRNLRAHGYLLGGLAPVGQGVVRLAYSTYGTNAAGNPGAEKIAVGYVHHLSKQTSLYSTYAKLRNRGGASFALGGAVTAANRSSQGLDAGISHRF